jgi:hypothetical protein
MVMSVASHIADQLRIINHCGMFALSGVFGASIAGLIREAESQRHKVGVQTDMLMCRAPKTHCKPPPSKVVLSCKEPEGQVKRCLVTQAGV